MKITQIASLSIILCSGLFNPIRAQEPAEQTMTLKECIAFSLENHPSAKAASFDVETAKHRANEATSYYLPQVAGTGTTDDNIKRMTTVIPAGAFSPTDLKVQFGNQYTSNLYAQVDQVIYDQTLIAGLSANKPNMELANLQKSKNEQTLIYNTAISYYNVIIQKKRLTLLNENETKLKELLRIQKLKLEKGVIQKVDVDRVQVNYNNILSQKIAIETNYTLAINQLKNAMGLDLNKPLSIDETIEPEFTVIENEEVGQSEGKTLDYKIQEQNLRLKEIDLNRKRASVLPTVNAYVRYGAQTFNNNFGDQFKNLYDYSAIGLRLNVPIFSGLRRYSQIKQSELSLFSAKELLQSASNSMELDVLNAYTALKTTQSKLLADKENLELAKSVFENTNLQYQKGVVSLSDFLNTEFTYKEAQNDYISSLLNYSINRLDLERSKGTLQQYIQTI